MPTRVLLLGGGGFIGSNLAYALDRRSDYTCLSVDLDDTKLRQRYQNAPYAFAEHDLEAPNAPIDDLVAGADIVIDLVAKVHPQDFLDDPLQVVNLNFFQCLKVVEACVRHRKRLLHFSTSEVYGKTGGSPAPFQEDETDCILGPVRNHRWIYSSAKQLLDRMIHAYGRQGDLDYTLVRPFNFIGPLMDYYVTDVNAGNPRVFANFMSALMQDRPLQLVDGGHSRRCFTDIADAVEALVLILDRPDRFNREIVNIGNPDNEIAIAGLAERMRTLYKAMFGPTGSSIEAVDARRFYGEGYEDCDRRLPDITKLAQAGWQPRYDLDATLRRSMRHFYDNAERLPAPHSVS